jgi:hypothetical protein
LSLHATLVDDRGRDELWQRCLASVRELLVDITCAVPELCLSRSNDAGWSSLVARQAHNLKAAGSNPAPATKRALRVRVFHSNINGAE